MGVGSNPETGTNHWQPIFPVGKVWGRLDVRHSEYRANIPTPTEEELKDLEALVLSDTPNAPNTMFTPLLKEFGPGVTMLGENRRPPRSYNSSIFGGSLGLITSPPRSDWSDLKQLEREVPDRLVPPAMSVVWPQLTTARVREHIGLQGFDQDSERAIMAMLKLASATSMPQSSSHSTTPLVKAHLNTLVMNPDLLQRLQHEGFTPPFPVDLFQSDTLLNAMKVKGRVQQYAELLWLYTMGRTLPL